VSHGDQDRLSTQEAEALPFPGAPLDLRRYKVFVEGVQRQNAKGQDVMIPLDPSNLLIIEVDTSDERRFS